MDIDQKIQDICDRVYGKQSIRCTAMDSLTNYVFKLDFEKPEGHVSVVLKILNRDKVNHFLFRTEKTEEILFKTKYLTDMILVYDQTFRIERFIHSKPLDLEWFRSHDTHLLLMRQVARFHSLASASDFNEALVFDTWKNKLPEILTVIEEKIKGHEDAETIHKIMEHYTRFLVEELPPSAQKQEVTLIHNDLLAGNILFDLDRQQFTLIDFEFSGYGFPATDLYNILIESTYDYNVENNLGYVQDKSVFPNDDQIKEMTRFYLFFRKYGSEFLKSPDTVEQLKVYRSDPRLLGISDEEIMDMFGSFFLLGSLTSLYWSSCGFYTAKIPGKNFDFLKYGIKRYDDFLWALSKHSSRNHVN